MELHRIMQIIEPPPSCDYGFTFQAIGAPAGEKGRELGGNCVDVPPEAQSWLAITVEWTDSADDELARRGMHQLVTDLKTAANKHGCLVDYLFMNDASYTQSPLRTLPEDTLEFLRKTARKYDHEEVFQKLQNGGFLLSKA